MSFLDNNSPSTPGQGAPSNIDIVVQLQGIAQQLSALVAAFSGRFSFGTFTLSAAATTVVPDTSVKSNSYIDWDPTNAAAATLMAGSKSLYRSTVSAGTSFTLATADGTAAVGTETFAYTIITPS